ncbi:hypothetical protein DITRI_Ditri13aG0128200 [Diplodiscus trichospermus]
MEGQGEWRKVKDGVVILLKMDSCFGRYLEEMMPLQPCFLLFPLRFENVHLLLLLWSNLFSYQRGRAGEWGREEGGCRACPWLAKGGWLPSNQRRVTMPSKELSNINHLSLIHSARLSGHSALFALSSTALFCQHKQLKNPAESLMYKNRLQEFTQRSSIPLPVYQTSNEGPSHAPKFRSKVIVDGSCYVSGETRAYRKEAEEDVARHALECIAKKIKDNGFPVILEDTLFCRSILNEFAVKMNMKMPNYNDTIQVEGLLPIFVSSVVFNGVTYSGETGRSKKEAEQLAARAAIVSLLGDIRYGTFLSEIIKSKAKLYVAMNKVKDSSIFCVGGTPAGADSQIP